MGAPQSADGDLVLPSQWQTFQLVSGVVSRPQTVFNHKQQHPLLLLMLLQYTEAPENDNCISVAEEIIKTDTKPMTMPFQHDGGTVQSEVGPMNPLSLIVNRWGHRLCR